MSWAEGFELVRRYRNSHAQARLAVVNVVVAFVGGLVLWSIAQHCGLYIPPVFAGGGRGTFDFLNDVFILMWATTFHSLRVNDGLRYHLRMRRNGPGVPRGRTSDALILVICPVVAVLWGALTVHGVFAARAADARYGSRLPYGTPPGVLEQGVTAVTAAYFVTIATVFLFVLLGARFNPVDLEEYDRYLGGFLPRRKRPRPFS